MNYSQLTCASGEARYKNTAWQAVSETGVQVPCRRVSAVPRLLLLTHALCTFVVAEESEFQRAERRERTENYFNIRLLNRINHVSSFAGTHATLEGLVLDHSWCPSPYIECIIFVCNSEPLLLRYKSSLDYV